MDFILIGFTVAGLWCLGIACAVAVAGQRLMAGPRASLVRLACYAALAGLGLVLGIMAVSSAQFACSLADRLLGRVLLGRGCSLTLSAIGIIAGPIMLRRYLGRRQLHSVSDEAGNIPANTEHQLARFCRMAIAVLFVFAVTQTMLTPQRFWDERAFYGIKAIVLFEDRTIASADLLNADFVQGHPRYPLLIPLAEHHIYASLGRVDDRWAKLLFPLLYLGMLLTFAGVLMRHVGINLAWLGTLLLATAPVLMPDDYGFTCGQADAPVACFEGVAALYLWDAIRSTQLSFGRSRSWVRSLLLASLASGAAAWTKDEGISHGIVRLIALGCAAIAGILGDRGATAARRQTAQSRSDEGRNWLRLLWDGGLTLTVVPALMLGPWFAHRRRLPLTGEMNYFGRLSPQALWDGLPSLGWSIPHLAERMFGEAVIWGLQWWLVAMAGLLFPRKLRQPSQLFLLLTLVGDLGALLIAGMIAPVMLEEHLGGSSHRYLMQLVPTAMLFVIGQLAPQEKSSSTTILDPA